MIISLYSKINKKYNIMIILYKYEDVKKMQSKNSIMTTFFIGTIGAMLILCGLIFLIYLISSRHIASFLIILIIVSFAFNISSPEIYS